jgi:hypothetical protein
MKNIPDGLKKKIYQLTNSEFYEDKSEKEKKNIIKKMIIQIKESELLPVEEIESIKTKLFSSSFFLKTEDKEDNILFNINSDHFESTKDNSLGFNIYDNDYLYENEIENTNYSTKSEEEKIINDFFVTLVNVKLYPGDTLQLRKTFLIEYIKNLLPNYFKDNN